MLGLVGKHSGQMGQGVERAAQHVGSDSTIDHRTVSGKSEREALKHRRNVLADLVIENDRRTDNERAVQPEVRGAVRDGEVPTREMALDDLEAGSHPLDHAEHVGWLIGTVEPGS